MIFRSALIISFWLTIPNLYSQPYNFPLNRESNELLLGNAADTTYNFHPTLQPYLESEITGFRADAESGENEGGAPSRLMDSDLVAIRHGPYYVSLDPIINAVIGIGSSNDSADQVHNFSVGLRLRSHYRDKVALEFDFTHSNSAYPDYVESRIAGTKVVPGFGFARGSPDNLENNFYSGYLSYAPSGIVNFQLGYGKHFIGSGYRSLLLSDNSNAHPFGRIDLKFWKVKYQVLYSNYQDIRNSGGQWKKSKNKYSTSNFLSTNIGRHANVGLFQTVIWQGRDSSYNRDFDVNYLNPFVFLRPVEFSIGSPDNILMGLDFNYTFFKKYKFYGQLLIDEFLLDSLKSGNGWWANKYGYQLGLKFHELFGVSGLTLQMEHNFVRPYTYSHSNVIQNYGNFNEPLAHTFGANFKELVGRIIYRKNRWLLTLHAVYAETGRDYLLTDYGGDIFKSNKNRVSESGNFTAQGVSTTLNYEEIKVGYLINPKWKLMFEFSAIKRDVISTVDENGLYFQFGLKTALYNQYLDF